MEETTNPTILQDAQNILANLSAQVSGQNIGGQFKEGLIASSNSIQSILNNVFTNNGVITKEQVNQLDEEIRLAKFKLLQSQSQKSILNLSLFVGGLVVAVGVLWFITKPSQTN
jgi:hypothetical protein